jgi:AcrR family transcriptional regulator
MPRADRERSILDVAGPVFAQRGFHAASMDEIASIADVSKPMLYACFGSKQGLYLAYVERTGGVLVQRLRGAAERSRSLPPRRRVEAPISEFVGFVAEHRDAWIVLFRETAGSEPIAAEVAELREQVAAAVRRMLPDGGAGPAGDAIAHAIVGAGESIANWWLAHPEVDRDEVAGWYVGLVQATLAALPRTR